MNGGHATYEDPAMLDKTLGQIMQDAYNAGYRSGFEDGRELVQRLSVEPSDASSSATSRPPSNTLTSTFGVLGDDEQPTTQPMETDE